MLLLLAQLLLAAEPDTQLVFQNGSEVQGTLLGMEGGQYMLELADGRKMSYPAADVVKVTPLAAPAAETPIADLCKGTILVTETVVPPDLYTVVKDLRTVKGWYGGLGEMPPQLAKAAREAGADAVVNARMWIAPSAWSWASPKAEGLAVKWTEKAHSTHVDVVAKCY